MQINKLLMKNQAYKVAIKKARSLWKISRIVSQPAKSWLPSNLGPGKAEAQLKSKAETGDDLQYIVGIWVSLYFFWLRIGNAVICIDLLVFVPFLFFERLLCLSDFSVSTVFIYSHFDSGLPSASDWKLSICQEDRRSEPGRWERWGCSAPGKAVYELMQGGFVGEGQQIHRTS